MSVWIGRNVSELLNEETTGGIKLLHIKMEEAEFGHMSCKMEEDLRFLYVLKGIMVCQVNQEREELFEGEGIFINCGSAYRLTESKKDGGEFLLLSVEKGCMGDVIMWEKYVRPIAESADFPFLKLTKDAHGGILEVLSDTGRIAEERAICCEMELKGAVYRIWAELYREFAQLSPALKKGTLRETVKLRKMLSFLHEHYREKITLGELAGDIGVSSGEYCRFFKKQMEQTPFEYLQAYRIEQSLPELLEKSGSIAEVALNHGFHGSSYYAETFKKEMGCAPGDYRKWCLSEGDMKCPLKKRKEAEGTDSKAAEERNPMPAHLL